MKRKRGRIRRWSILKSAIMAVCAVLLVTAAYIGGRWLETRNEEPEARGNYLQRLWYQDTIEVDGETYRRRGNMTTILLMGIDRESSAASSGFRNGGQADFLRLLVIDHAARIVHQLQIDRDTMTPITTLGVTGAYSGMRTAQICLSYGFGDGGKQSCELTRDAVSAMLLGAPVDLYMAMNLDGISALNDWVGGVRVTLEDDFTSVDPTMKQGETILLIGDQAQTYVRSRMAIGVGTNEARMVRQQNYIAQLSAQMVDKLKQNESMAGELYDALEPYMITDIARGRMVNEAWAVKDYETKMVAMAGQYEDSGEFMKFWLDEEALQTSVLELFYEKVK